MKPGLLLASLSLSLCTACSAAAPEESKASGPTAEELVERLRAEIAEQAQRPEHTDPEVTIQHLLVGVAGALPDCRRPRGEAETMAAQLFARVRSGEDFDALVKNYTDDEHPGIYTMSLTASDPPRAYRRDQMVPAFGDVAWRLAVGDIGVAPYDGDVAGPNAKSPYGWHIVKRLR